jgi:chitinase
MLLALLATTLLGLTTAVSPNKTVIGYYASWQWYDRSKLAEPKNMDFSKVTRVNFAFFQTDTNGYLSGTDSWADPQVLFGPSNWNPSPTDKLYCSWDAPNLKNCNAHYFEDGLIGLAHAAGAEVYPSIGGWTLSNTFPTVAASPTARSTFASQCVDLIKDYDFDGIDIDWEYPGYGEHAGTPADKGNYNLLLGEIRTKLDQLEAETGKHYGLTAALPCGPSMIDNIDVGYLSTVLDEFNLMSYDLHGSWDPVTGVNSPLYYQGFGETSLSTDSCVKTWVQRGASQNRVNIGLAFYGRSFQGAKGLNQAHSGADTITWADDEGIPQYFNIVSKLSTMTSVWHEPSKTKYAYFSSGGFVSYDDERAICEKTDYVIQNDLNGFIIWELSGDLMPDLSTPLLNAVNDKLQHPSLSCDGGGSNPTNSPIKSPTPPSPTPPVGNPTKVPSKSPTKSPTPNPTTTPVGNPTKAPSVSTDKCCSWDFKTCGHFSECDTSESQCRSVCGGLSYISKQNQCTGLGLYDDCTMNTNGCCSPLQCEGSVWYKRCMENPNPPSTPNSSSPTKSPVTSPVKQSASPTKSPVTSPVASPVASPVNQSDFCCTWDYNTCAYGWCSDSEANCASCGGGIWWDGQPLSCLWEYENCTNNIDGCCDGFTCTGDQFYRQCLKN